MNDEEEEKEKEKEDAAEDDDEVNCVGEVCFDRDENPMEQKGNFCLHCPLCPIQSLS